MEWGHAVDLFVDVPCAFLKVSKRFTCSFNFIMLCWRLRTCFALVDFLWQQASCASTSQRFGGHVQAPLAAVSLAHRRTKLVQSTVHGEVQLANDGGLISSLFLRLTEPK